MENSENQGETMAIEHDQEVVAGGDEEKKMQKSGRRKWFKRSSSTEKRPKNSETKKRSSSVFSFLCGLHKRKDKKKSGVETTDGLDKGDQIASGNDHDDDGIEPIPDRLIDDPIEEEPVAADRSSKAEAEFTQSMADIKRDWLDFGKSLDIDDAEMIEVMERAELTPMRSSKTAESQVVSADLEPVLEDDESELDQLKKQTPPLQLQSTAGAQYPSIMPVGAAWDASKCSSMAFMTRVIPAKKETAEKPSDSVLAPGILSSCESKLSNELLNSQTVDAPKKGSFDTRCGSESSFYSITTSTITSSVTCLPGAPVRDETEKTCVGAVNSVTMEDWSEQSVTVNDEKSMEEVVKGKC